MKYIFTLLALATLLSWGNAQKIGHINYGNLLETLPAVIDADKRLTTYQDSLGKALQAKVVVHRARIEENKKKYDAGELTKVEANSINQSLNQEQAQLIDDQQRAEATIMIRKQGYLQPIIAHVNEVIAQYGKEKGYDLILDESSGSLLFDLPAHDLTDKIRQLMTK